MESFATATGHDAATIATTESDCKLQDRGQNDDAVRFVEHALRDAIGCSQNFLHYFPGILDTVLLFILRVSVADQHGQS